MIKLWLKQRCLDKVEAIPCGCKNEECEGISVKPEVKVLWLSWQISFFFAFKMAFKHKPEEVLQIITYNYVHYLEYKQNKKFEKALDSFFNDDDFPQEG